MKTKKLLCALLALLMVLSLAACSPSTPKTKGLTKDNIVSTLGYYDRFDNDIYFIIFDQFSGYVTIGIYNTEFCIAGTVVDVKETADNEYDVTLHFNKVEDTEEYTGHEAYDDTFHFVYDLNEPGKIRFVWDDVCDETLYGVRDDGNMEKEYSLTDENEYIQFDDALFIELHGKNEGFDGQYVYEPVICYKGSITDIKFEGKIYSAGYAASLSIVRYNGFYLIISNTSAQINEKSILIISKDSGKTYAFADCVYELDIEANTIKIERYSSPMGDASESYTYEFGDGELIKK